MTGPDFRLPPTSPALLDETTKPYFLWWTDATVGQLKEHLRSPDPEERAYWMGALLREANSRAVWLFVTTAEIRALWPRLIRYLGRSRQMWAWLLDFPPPEWPPVSQIRAGHAHPLPGMLEPLSSDQLVAFRNELAERAERLKSGTKPVAR